MKSKLQKKYNCQDCFESFNPGMSKKFCDDCFERLVIMIDHKPTIYEIRLANMMKGGKK